ncbi:hypothetical protein BH20ACT6_BH20ACT6_20850 [soil metagenome]
MQSHSEMAAGFEGAHEPAAESADQRAGDGVEWLGLSALLSVLFVALPFTVLALQAR